MLVGLNNPEDKYEKTRHNIGFEAVFHIAYKLNATWFVQDDALVSIIHDGNTTILFVKPTTGMNKSGTAVAELARYYNVNSSDIIVFHDDIDLAPGKIKAKQGGGPGGHNGVKSIDWHVGPEYARVRIGVGRPADKSVGVLNHVLGDFTQDDVVWISDKLEKISVNFRLLFDNNYEKFMKACL